MLLGLLAAAAALLVANLALIGLVEGTGADLQTRDAGDVFVKAGTIAAYMDERLAAAAKGEGLPAPPALLADQTAIALGMGTTLAFSVVLIAVVALVTREGAGRLARGLQLNRFRARDLWRPALAAVGCYVMIAIYSALVSTLDIDALEPRSTVPFEVVRASLTIALAGVAAIVAAPLAEELFYRGLVFGGLQRWGFWPAALLSGVLFSAVHFDPGSLIPFFIIGVVLAWLFWRRGALWESVAFHMLFNTASFSLLLATEA